MTRGELPINYRAEIDILTLDVFGRTAISTEEVCNLARLAEGRRCFLDSEAVKATLLETTLFESVDVFVWRGATVDQYRGHVLVDVVERGNSQPLANDLCFIETIEISPSFITLLHEYTAAFDQYTRLPPEQRALLTIDTSRGDYRLGFAPLRRIEEEVTESVDTHLDTLLLCVLHDRAAERRRAATWALGWASDKDRVAQVLAQAITDPDDQVRNLAARGLEPMLRLLQVGGRAPPIPVEPVFRLFLQPHVMDRQKAAGLLGVLARDPVIARRLRAELRDRFFKVAATKLPIHRRAIMLAIRYLIGDTPLTYAQATEWLRKTIPDEMPWWSRHDVARAFRVDFEEPIEFK